MSERKDRQKVIEIRPQAQAVKKEKLPSLCGITFETIFLGKLSSSRSRYREKKGKKIVKMPYDHKKEVYQEAHQIARIRTTKDMNLNSLYIRTGSCSDLFVLDLDLDSNKTLNTANAFQETSSI